MRDSLQNSYVLDDANRIVSVGPEWDAFAAENDAPGAMARNVIDREIWDFVSGFQTRSYLNAIFFACRMDTEGFSLAYRCDAPHVQRLFRLSIVPQDKGRLALEHRLVHSKERPLTSDVEVFSEHYDCTRCSVCCAFLVGENWIDTFSFPEEQYFPKGYGVCPNCRDDARRLIAGRGHARGSGNVVEFSKWFGTE